MGEKDEEKNERGFVVVDRRGASEEEGAEGAEAREAAEAGAQEAADSPRPADSGPSALPQVDFSMLIHSFAISALYHLGAAPDPESGARAEVNLPLARQNIDILEVIEEKTRGNLDEEEARLLKGLLYELHMRFVEASESGSG